MEQKLQVSSLYADLRADYEREIDAPFTDSLTGLFNHGFFLEILGRELKRSRRYAVPFSLAMVDIDAFGLFNRQHGSVQGDRALIEVARAIRANIRESDLASRYLGNVFVLLLTDTDAPDAEAVLSRIRIAIDERYHGELTVCIGCVSSRNAQDRDDLMRRTKEALSSAKVRGRGSIHVVESARRPVDEGRLRMLVVEDEPRNMLLEAMLHPFNCEVINAASGEEALRTAERVDIDLILLDAMMPEMDGFETCRRLKESSRTRTIPVLMMTVLDDTESKVRAIEAGADDLISKPPNKVELVARIRALIQTKRLNDSLVSIENVLFSLANAVEAKDAYTEGHVKRVSNLAVDLGRMMGLQTRDIEALRVGGILHDIGKIGIPDSVLNKPGPMNAEEWEMVKAHPVVGFRVAEPLKQILKGALEVIRHHHERMDGSGYPDGIKGEEISAVARVMAVADVYDALVTDRPYHKGVSKEKALSIMQQDVDEGRLDRAAVSSLAELVFGSKAKEEGASA